MVTRRNRPEMDEVHAEEDLRQLLAAKTLEVTQLRQRIEDLELRGTRFLSAASHAVMNPVTIIRSYLEIVLSDLQAGLSSEQVEFMQAASVAASRLTELVENIVEFSALEMGVAELEIATVEVSDVVTEVCQRHAALAESGDVELRLAVAPHLPRVRADRNRLAKAVGEVVLNAVQWTPKNGRVEVSVDLANSAVIIRVTDTGQGIPGDRLDEVCEPFTRFSGKDGVARRGAGLGLSLARQQIERMGGHVGLSSELGRGTSVEISLPASAKDGTTDGCGAGRS